VPSNVHLQTLHLQNGKETDVSLILYDHGPIQIYLPYLLT